MQYLVDFFAAGWHILEESSLYILLGLLVAGLLKVFLSPDFVAAHLGQGRVKSVFVITSYSIHYTKLYDQNMPTGGKKIDKVLHEKLSKY